MLRLSLLLPFFILTFDVEGQETLPPGVVKVDSILVDEKEITNLNWQEYLYHLSQDSSYLTYQAALPDTTVWEQVYDGELALAFKSNYLRAPAFRDFPVVGVSYEQAVAYCHWRSIVVTQKMNLGLLPGMEIIYRLPTQVEWQAVAQNEVSYLPLASPDNIDKMKFNRSDLAEIKERSGSGLSLKKIRTSIIAFYKRNLILLIENLNSQEEYEFKPYLGVGYGPKKSMHAGLVSDLRGNVSEMTSKKGTAMGGNWNTTFEESPIYRQFIYQGPSPVLGFRCLCEIKY